MVKKLRRKFVITAMSALLVVLTLIIAVLNIVNVSQIKRGADDLLQLLAENNGYFPDVNMMRVRYQIQEEEVTDYGEKQKTRRNTLFLIDTDGVDFARAAELPFESRYFVVGYDGSGNLSRVDTLHIAALTAEEAVTLADEAIFAGEKKGSLGNYRYLISTAADDGWLVIFKDMSSDYHNAAGVFRKSLVIGLVSVIGVFILVWLFSGKAVAPVVESLEKQKQFITDAGHELKTPLSVISANVDVLELTGESNEWTDSIRNQVKRMTGLVGNMLTLSRMDEESSHPVYSDFDLSSEVRAGVENFRALAESTNRVLAADIEDGITLHGDSAGIQQLLSILLDNAMKYARRPGFVRVGLRREKKNIVLEVRNDVENLPEGDLDRLFDRFYRADAARTHSGNGGFGIGLSVARAIVTSHEGTIKASCDGDHIIRFTVRF